MMSSSGAKMLSFDSSALFSSPLRHLFVSTHDATSSRTVDESSSFRLSVLSSIHSPHTPSAAPPKACVAAVRSARLSSILPHAFPDASIRLNVVAERVLPELGGNLVVMSCSDPCVLSHGIV